MIGNVVVFTYLPRKGRRTITFERPFFNESEYNEILKGTVAVFGQPDDIVVRRDVDLSAERERQAPEPKR